MKAIDGPVWRGTFPRSMQSRQRKSHEGVDSDTAALLHQPEGSRRDRYDSRRTALGPRPPISGTAIPSRGRTRKLAAPRSLLCQRTASVRYQLPASSYRCGIHRSSVKWRVMRHYVAYHNPEKMGYSAEEVTELCIVTNKAVENLIGDRIWLIQGEGKPRKYVLRGTFIVASVGADTEDGFRYVVRGREGALFQPYIPIGTLPWFERFKMSQGNFAFGLQRISDPAVVEELKRVSGWK